MLSLTDLVVLYYNFTNPSFKFEPVINIISLVDVLWQSIKVQFASFLRLIMLVTSNRLNSAIKSPSNSYVLKSFVCVMQEIIS